MRGPFEVLGFGREEFAEDADHGAVHPELDRAELRLDLVGGLLDGLPVGDVGR